MAFYTKIHFNQAFMAKTSCSCVYRGDFGKILCVEQRGPPNPTIPPAVTQCCQMAEIPAKKLKRGREKKKKLAKCPPKWQKRGKTCNDVFVKLAELFPNWPNFFDILAGTIWVPGNTAVMS
jgi:hypothetical protein